MPSGQRVSSRPARRLTGGTARPVVVIGLDQQVLTVLEDVCRQAGVSLLVINSIAELERWPDGHIVVTDAAHATPFWHTVGAAEVIVFAPSQALPTIRVDRAARELRGALELAGLVLALSAAGATDGHRVNSQRLVQHSDASVAGAVRTTGGVLRRIAHGDFFAGCVEPAKDPMVGPSAIATAQRDWWLRAR